MCWQITRWKVWIEIFVLREPSKKCVKSPKERWEGGPNFCVLPNLNKWKMTFFFDVIWLICWRDIGNIWYIYDWYIEKDMMYQLYKWMIKNCFNKKFYISNFSQFRSKVGLSNFSFFIKFKIVHIILVGWGGWWGVSRKLWTFSNFRDMSFFLWMAPLRKLCETYYNNSQWRRRIHSNSIVRKSILQLGFKSLIRIIGWGQVSSNILPSSVQDSSSSLA